MLTRLALTPATFLGNNVMPDLLGPVRSLFTYMFLHSDWGHLLGNMIFLWVFGDDVEEALGRIRFLIFYLGSGALAGLVYVASDPNSDIPLIGASGAIAGVVVAYVMLRPCARVTVLVTIIPLRLSAYWVIGAFVLMQIINLDSASRSESPTGVISAAWWRVRCCCSCCGRRACGCSTVCGPSAFRSRRCLTPAPRTLTALAGAVLAGNPSAPRASHPEPEPMKIRCPSNGWSTRTSRSASSRTIRASNSPM
jgi:membrane associated rhomboid family serine protease